METCPHRQAHWCHDALTFDQNTNIPNQTLRLATVQCQNLFGQRWIFRSHKLWLSVSLGCMLDVEVLKSDRCSDVWYKPGKYQTDPLQSCVKLLLLMQLKMHFGKKIKKVIICLFLCSHFGGFITRLEVFTLVDRLNWFFIYIYIFLMEACFLYGIK